MPGREAGKEPEPTGALIDSQSVKTTELAQSRGVDGHKKIKGRKRHIVVDTLGFLLSVKVHDANLSDGKESLDLLQRVFFLVYYTSQGLGRCRLSG